MIYIGDAILVVYNGGNYRIKKIYKIINKNTISGDLCMAVTSWSTGYYSANKALWFFYNYFYLNIFLPGRPNRA